MFVVGLFGISGVGKSFSSNYLKKELIGFDFTRASEIISSQKGCVDLDKLNSESVSSNQAILLASFESYLKKIGDRNVLVELHCLIETKDDFVLLPSEVLQSLNLNAAFFLYESAEVILSRRKNDLNRIRPIISIGDIDIIQNLAMKHFFETFAGTNTVLAKCRSSRPDKLLSLIRTVTQ